MVRIVNGEIVADDAPPRNSGQPSGAAPPSSGGGSAGSSHRPTAPPRTGGGAPQQQQPGLFDMSAPPFRLVDEAPGEGVIAGMPGVAIYGAHIKSTHLLMLLAAGLFIGWRGLLVGGIVWYVWASNRQQAPTAQQTGVAGGGGGAQTFFSQFTQQGGGSSAGRSTGGGSSGGTGAPGSTKWQGKGYKLGSS